ncbi:MAG TPA: PEP-CTERM sorting domain-containing protein [Acetobacteraceae bacterium]|jgi:hypothetical protein
MRSHLKVAFVAFGAVIVGVGCPSAQAAPYTYNFSDEYWLKAGQAFSSVFAGATGSASVQGLYQETATGSSPVITELHATSYLITGNNRFNTTPILGEFTQNDGSSALVLTGWTSTVFNSGANGVSHFQINRVESNPAAISLQYLTGATVNTSSGAFTGMATAFNLDSIDLSTAVGTATGYVVEGLLGGAVKYSEQICTNGNQYAVAPVSGSCGPYIQTATVPFNWSDIDTVEFGYINQSTNQFTTGWPNGGTLDMTNIVIDPNIAPVPEPMSTALLATGLIGLSLARRRRFT